MHHLIVIVRKQHYLVWRVESPRLNVKHCFEMRTTEASPDTNPVEQRGILGLRTSSGTEMQGTSLFSCLSCWTSSLSRAQHMCSSRDYCS